MSYSDYDCFSFFLIASLFFIGNGYSFDQKKCCYIPGQSGTRRIREKLVIISVHEINMEDDDDDDAMSMNMTSV